MKWMLALAIAYLAPFHGTKAIAADLSSTKIPPIHVMDNGMERLLWRIAEQSHVVIGFEADVDYVTEKQIDFDFPGGTLAQLADQCVSLLPGSSWRVVEDKSIVISSRGVAAQLAHLPINYPELAGATRRQIWSDLSSRPELTSWLNVTSCKRMELFMGGEWKGDKPTIDIAAGRITLESVLAAATIASDRYHWDILKYSREGQCEITIIMW